MGAYRELFFLPGAMRLALAGLLARMPMSMLGVGIVTMMSELTGSYSQAGGLAAVVAGAGAIMGPYSARLVDRFGQRRVTLPVLLVSSSAGIFLVWCIYAGASFWVLALCAAVVGCPPPAGSLVRARWAHICRDTNLLPVAYALEAAVEEVCFILGPFLAIGLSLTVFAGLGVLLAVTFQLVGGLALVMHTVTEPPMHARDEEGRKAAIRSRALQILTVTSMAAGAVFGGVDATAVAFAEEHGHKAAASVALSLYALASFSSGIFLGRTRFKAPTEELLMRWAAVMAVFVVPYLLVDSMAGLIAVSLVAGLAVSPVVALTTTLAEARAPAHQRTEGLTWIGVGIAAGMALGTATASGIVDAAGAHNAFWLPVAAAASTFAVTFIGRTTLRENCTPRTELPLAPQESPQRDRY
ncbi:MFS transporter [Streptomyces sp. NPDC085614]|uniref:MFS transporter n=1 Tax=Streptomyces sp. NPDC085614 TaxID=3365733 RepID=UPI0037D2305B